MTETDDDDDDDADKRIGLNPHFGSEWHPDPDSNPGSFSVNVRRLGEGLCSLSTYLNIQEYRDL